MPSRSKSSRPRTSTETASWASAISRARSARKLGVATFDGRFWSSRARLAASDATRGGLGRGADVLAGEQLEALDLAGFLALLGRAEAIEAVGAEDRSLDERGRDRRGIAGVGQSPRDRRRFDTSCLANPERGRHAGALGLELPALAEADHEQALRGGGTEQGELLVDAAHVRRSGGIRERLAELLVREQAEADELGVGVLRLLVGD